MWRVCLLVVMVLGLAAGSWVLGRGAGDDRDWRERLLVGGEPPEVCNSFSLEIPMAKTQVSGEAYGLSFTFKHALWPGMDSWDLYIFDGLFFSANGIHFRISGGPATEGRWFFSVSLLPPFEGQGVDVIFDLPEEGYEYAEIPVSVTPSGMRLRSETYQNIIGKKSSATHSKEIAFTDSWFIPSGTEFTVAAGDGTMTVETTEDITVAGNLFISGGDIDADDWYNHLQGAKYTMSLEDIRFSGSPINTDDYQQTTWGGTAPSVDKLWVEGFGGNSIGFWSSEYFFNGPFIYNTYTGGAINAPFSYDFSQYQFKWMDDTNLPDALKVYCTGIRTLNSSGIDVGPWHGTIAELKALGRYVQEHGCYFWSTYEPDMQASVALYLDMTSAESLGIEIRGPRPEYKVEGAGFGQTVDTETEEVIPGPVDGQYHFHSYYNGEKRYTNGQYHLYCTDPEGPDWAIGPAPPEAPFYTQDAGGPAGAYLVNTAVYEDTIIDEETGQRKFSGFAGEGIGPAVSADTGEAINVDSDCRAPSFKHDATCCFDAWPLSATSRTASPYMTDVVSLTPVGTVGVYADAHTHEDWVGDNATTPTADGEFVVYAGGGTITLTLASNYIARQGKVGGVDEVLRRVDKGFTAAEIGDLCLRPQEAGLKMSATVILGLGGPALSAQHAQHTAALIDRVKPRFASALTLMLPQGEDDYRARTGDPRWRMLTPVETLQELRTLVAHVDGDGIIFRSNHASNYLALAGTFQKGKASMLAQIDAALANPRLLRPEFLRAL